MAKAVLSGVSQKPLLQLSKYSIEKPSIRKAFNLQPRKIALKEACTMLIGLIADTHDNLPMVEKAIKKLNIENVELVLHAGDYVAPFVIPKFRDLKAKLIGVFGNNDGDKELLKKRFSENERLEIRGNFAEINIGKAKIALLHGSEEELLRAIINSGNFDVVVHGHTHKAETYKK
ncbi:MAG: metallophosphoesterase, partial [Candidatus Bathyarchaeia archaeon]